MTNGAPFTDFEHDPNETGIHWEHFITAVGIWTYLNEDRGCTVAEAAMTFCTTPELVRKAIEEHPWIFTNEDPDPTKQIIESDGE